MSKNIRLVKISRILFYSVVTHHAQESVFQEFFQLVNAVLIVSECRYLLSVLCSVKHHDSVFVRFQAVCIRCSADFVCRNAKHFANFSGTPCFFCFRQFENLFSGDDKSGFICKLLKCQPNDILEYVSDDT